ncbi:excisionase family DNA-binding protein [Mycolicibacter algericus]|uniref:excisionase family DNA-binding protein n=1 Tax=Mycolicibacter algericus TaxID=1288388 RepID=UPI003C7250F0
MSCHEILTPKAVNLSRAAQYLGISVQSVRRRIAEGSLPAFRVGPKSIRVYIDDLEALKQPIGGGAR